MFSTIFVFTMFILVVLAIASIAGIFSERVGIVNLAIEGMMIVGAAFYSLIGSTLLENSNNLTATGALRMEFQIVLLLASGFFSMIFAALHGFISIRLKGDQIISGIALNLFAVGIAWAIIIVQPGRKFEGIISELAMAPTANLGQYGNILSLKFFLLIFIVIGGYILLNRTKWGLRFRAIGQNPQAADVAGINVAIYQWEGVLISGFLAGLAGGIYIQNTGINTFQASVQGLGFLAIAIMIMGRWKIIYALIVSLGFSFLYSTGIIFGSSTDPAISNLSNILLLVPFLSTLVIMTLLSKNNAAPAHLGRPYDKSVR